MAPPLYADLGKQARDVFGKGYNFGFVKFDTTTKPHDNGKIKLNAAHNVNTGTPTSNIELEYKVPKYNMTLTEKWNSDNTFGTEIQVADQVTKNSKMTLISSFSPVTKSRNAMLKAEFGQDALRINADCSLLASPVINAAVVFKYQNFLIGAKSGYNTEKQQLTETNVAFGRDIGNFVLHFAIHDQSRFEGSVYHKVNPQLELAGQCAWTQGTPQPTFGVGAVYKVDKDWTLRGKIAQNGQAGVSTCHQLNPHLKMTLSALLNVKAFNEGGHKFGAGLEYEPCC